MAGRKSTEVIPWRTSATRD